MRETESLEDGRVGPTPAPVSGMLRLERQGTRIICELYVREFVSERLRHAIISTSLFSKN